MHKGSGPVYFSCVIWGFFPDDTAIKNNDGIIGVLSLIIYSIISIALIKYILIVMVANDNGMVSHMRLFEIEYQLDC